MSGFQRLHSRQWTAFGTKARSHRRPFPLVPAFLGTLVLVNVASVVVTLIH